VREVIQPNSVTAPYAN